jgi:hypothetical protein
MIGMVRVFDDEWPAQHGLPDSSAETIIQATPREPVRIDASLVETPRIGGDT